MTVTSLIETAKVSLRSLYEESIQQEQVAWWLMQKATGKQHIFFIAHPETPLTAQEQELFEKLVHEHVILKKPLQYILGSVPFGDLDIIVEPPVLIPRPETEEWVFALIDRMHNFVHDPLRILDLCCGSGCIALALAHAFPASSVYASDIAQEAVLLTAKNSAHNGLPNVSVVLSDLFAGLPRDGKYDLIVTNPPYVTQQEWHELDRMVRDWEDPRALVAHDDGLQIIKQIIDQAPALLVHNNKMHEQQIPQLVIEMSDHQTATVAAYMRAAGWYDVTIARDYAGQQRIVMGRFTHHVQDATSDN